MKKNVEFILKDGSTMSFEVMPESAATLMNSWNECNWFNRQIKNLNVTINSDGAEFVIPLRKIKKIYRGKEYKNEQDN